MVHFLYKDFLNQRKIYQLNRGFWTRLFKGSVEKASITYKKWLNNYYGNGTKFWDGNPIFDALVIGQRKAIRIIQEEPLSDTPEISAWIQDTEDQFKQPIEELVISLELSTETKKIAQELIEAWLVEGKNSKSMEKFIDRKLNSIVHIA